MTTLGDYAQRLATKRQADKAAAEKVAQAAAAAARAKRAQDDQRFATFVLAPLRNAKNELSGVTGFDYKNASGATRIVAEFTVGHPHDGRKVTGQIELTGGKYVFMTGGRGKQDVGNGVADDSSIAAELDGWLRDMLDRYYGEGAYAGT